MSSFYGVGITSGTSLDGLDFCFAEFTGDPETDVWGYRLEETSTVEYSKIMKNKLETAAELSALDLIKLQFDYSHYVGQCLQRFIQNNDFRPDFVASLGHMVFHQPDQGITYQMGDGEVISTYIRCPLVTDFRTKDVALGGQGAPLVSCGEKFLFHQTDLCISLGGIANVGCQGEKGFDVCLCNVVLNHLTSLSDPDLQYDPEGELAATGSVLPEVLKKLDDLEYYHQNGPKSLGSEWISSKLMPILDPKLHSVPDLLRTYIEHISKQVCHACVRVINKSCGTVLVTGGGVHNKTLMTDLKRRLRKHGIKTVDTDQDIVEFKETLICAFLGLRSLLNMENVFCSVTGSKMDSVSGSVHHGSVRHSRPSLQDRFNFMIRRKSLGVAESRIVKDT